MQNDASPEEINKAVQTSSEAFQIFKKISLQQRAEFLKTIASLLELSRQELIEHANLETNLPATRLHAELTRTIFQLTNYAEHCAKGCWLDVRIDTADNKRNPPKPDLRKTLIPIGPVVVFGSSNFPFAYSTAGGDTACAFAAGCTVIVKAHPAHIKTGNKVASIIQDAVEKCCLPNGVFTHINGEGNASGEMLVKHTLVKAVGFTGSFAGGKQLFDWGNQRKEPIPVFAEMGSVNPIFILPEKLKEDPLLLADTISGSIVLGVGQFCTNPGIIVVLKEDPMDVFLKMLIENIENTSAAAMLNRGIYENYISKKENALQQPGVKVLARSKGKTAPNYGEAVIATIDAQMFIQNPTVQQEVFGPYSIIVQCENTDEMYHVARVMEGQLTTTLFSTIPEILEYMSLMNLLTEKCGRIIFNGVPTGVEVGLAMHHGGPYPATTDSRFTSVGADGIKRFARPITFQNWPDELLPDELKTSNPLCIWRIVNHEMTNKPI